MTEKTAHGLVDTRQTVWQLASIQLSGWTSLPILATSVLILQDNSFYGAVLTIIVGNALLWFVRLAIIAMSYKKRQSTLDISRDYLGHKGSYFIAVLCLISTLVWFIAQTTAASNTLTHLIAITEDPNIDQFVQMSVLLGILSTFLCMEGIVFLKKFTSFVFPILLAAFVVVIFTLPFHLPTTEETALSLSGLTLVLGTNLGITSDFPTFFRHSKSLQTSITALTVIQLISLGLGLCSLFFGSIITGAFEVDNTLILGSGNEILRIFLIVLIFLSVISANVANVYSASVGWEVIAPKTLVGRKEYLILGLGLTTLFILLSRIFSVEFLLNASDSSLVNLCVVLTIGYLTQRFTKKMPGAFEQKFYFFAWLLSSLVNTLQFGGMILTAVSPLVTGIGIIGLTCLLSILTTAIAVRAKKWIQI